MLALFVHATTAFGLFVTEPRRDCIGGSIPPTALFALFAIVPIASFVTAGTAAPTASFTAATAAAIVIVTLTSIAVRLAGPLAGRIVLFAVVG
jgi:hypothetical protein